MPLSSMTGFARGSSVLDELHWQWELKSVNAKGLDVRCRLPTGFEGLEAGVRTVAAEKLKRGSLQVALSVSGQVQAETWRLNEGVLEQVLSAAERLRERIGGAPISADVVLGMRGVLEITAADADEAALERRDAAIMASFRGALDTLIRARHEEGIRLQARLADQINRIETLVLDARDHPARSAPAIKVRLTEQVARLMETGAAFDESRLHQEAVLIATRADIQEELDRLISHIEAARALIASGEAIGREFEFLAQEFNREANTMCSKAIDKSLTRLGLDLKTVIDQMREQVQNIE